MANVAGTNLHAGDITVIVLYFAFILFVGLWTSRKNRGSVGGYFLAGRNMNWLPLGASLFASNVGSLHFVGLAGSGAAAGIAIAVYELNAIFVVLMLGWLFVPVYIASGVFTMPEYMKKRFGGQRIRIYLAVLSLAMYIFTKISADLYAGAIFIEQSLRWNLYLAICLLLAIASIFTITGGLTAVIWTDFIQTIIMTIGAFALMIISFVRVGGFENMQYLYLRAIPNTTLQSNTTCGYPNKEAMHLFRGTETAKSSGDIPWPGIIGLTINSIWYWCADQVIVQRSLAAKNYSHSKGGTIFAGYLKILPLFVIVFPGMIARILFPDDVGCADPDECWRICKSRAGCTNIAYPMLVLSLMPAGARGIMLAVMLSALMSSLTSIFNSSSTIFTMDIWRRIRRKASEVELMIVGRVSVIVLVGISILWIPIIQLSQGSQLFVYIQQVSSFLQPPICAVYLLALFWHRINEKGAFVALMIGLLVGVVRFVLEFSYPLPSCGDPDNRPSIITEFHYLYFATVLFVLTVITAVVVSLLTEPIDKKHLYRLTFWTRHSKEPRVDIDSNTIDGATVGTHPETFTLSPHDDKDFRIADEAQMDIYSDKATAQEDRLDKTNEAETIPWWKTCFRWICGIEKKATQEVDQTDRQIREAKMLSIEEKPFWNQFCAINAVILMTGSMFLWGFFA